MPSLQSNEEETRSRVLEQAPVLPGLPEITSKLLPLAQARDLYHKARHETDGFQLERLLAEMRIELRVDAADLSRIPTTGPVVAVSNHPFGILDGVVLAVLLSRVRPDVKILTNSLLAGIKDLERTCIFVDPFGAASAEINRRALRQSMAWLTQRGMLAIFPAGEVSHWRLPEGEIVDPRWNETAARLIRKQGAAALPVYFCGQNSLAFQLLGMIHPRLRTVFLLREFLQQMGKRVEVRIGSAIPAESVSNLPNDREASEYLRWRTYLLAERGRPRGQLPALVRAVLPRMPQQVIAGGQTRELLISEIRALPAERRLAENAEFSVFAAQSQEIPHLLQEIGRLREITFRAVGEGTGRSTDLDRFDQYYWHFFLWSKTTRELAGAYRAGQTDQILAAHGTSGLYTGTLFRFDQRLFQKLGPALELGRSFICLEYQRQYAPLLLLWKGIARFVAARPQTPILFGAVSISSAYSHASRELMVRFFESRAQGDELSRLIRPRTPFRPARIRTWDCSAMCHALRDLDELAEPITDVEVDGKGLPILLKQYAKVGGNLVSFNVDRKFSNALDGLVIVDLRKTDPNVLERYMGRDGLHAFREYHGLTADLGGLVR